MCKLTMYKQRNGKEGKRKKGGAQPILQIHLALYITSSSSTNEDTDGE